VAIAASFFSEQSFCGSREASPLIQLSRVRLHLHITSTSAISIAPAQTDSVLAAAQVDLSFVYFGVV
jgi:hypothetical protein